MRLEPEDGFPRGEPCGYLTVGWRGQQRRECEDVGREEAPPAQGGLAYVFTQLPLTGRSLSLAFHMDCGS